MRSNIVIAALVIAILGGCALVKKSESNPAPAKEVVKFQCKDCESQNARLKQEIASLSDQLASARKEADDSKIVNEEDEDIENAPSIWRRVLVNGISVATGIAIGYFAFRCKKKV